MNAIDKKNLDKLIDDKITEALKHDIMAESVRQCLEQLVLVPVLDKAEKMLAELQEQIDDIKSSGVARCPECGHVALWNSMCEDLAYTCPCCGLNAHWRYHEKNECYTIERGDQ